MTPIEADLIQSVIDGVDYVARQSETKWGVGRLRLLVSDDLRARFDRQARMFNEAVWQSDVPEVRRHGDALRRAYGVLEQAAASSGAQPVSAHARAAGAVLTASQPDGSALVIAPDNVTATAVLHDYRQLGLAAVAYTVDEVARLMPLLSKISQVKEAFPGAEVVAYRTTKPPVDWRHGDDLPFSV